MSHVLLVFLLSFLFILENIFTMHGGGLAEHSVLVPHFLLIALLFLAIYTDYTKALIYSAIFGLLYDIVYTEVLGVYVFAFLFAVFVFKFCMGFLQTNLFIISFLSLVFVLLVELYVYGILNLFGTVSMGGVVFLNQRVIPTLLLNTIFIILLCFPLKKYLSFVRAEFDEK